MAKDKIEMSVSDWEAVIAYYEAELLEIEKLTSANRKLIKRYDILLQEFKKANVKNANFDTRFDRIENVALKASKHWFRPIAAIGKKILLHTPNDCYHDKY